MINKNDVKDMYPLSPMQEGILFHYLVDKTSSSYFEQLSYSLDGQIDHPLLQEAFNRLIERYDVLRTIFLHEKVKRPLQIVLKNRKAAVDYKDISQQNLNEHEIADFLDAYRAEDKQKGFDLSADLPIRVSLVKTAQDKYELIWSFHHIIMDGWCSDIIREEMMVIYLQLKNNREINLPQPMPYGRFIKWLEKQDKNEGLEYWNNYLEDYDTLAGIPRKESQEKDYLQGESGITVDSQLTQKLTRIANKNQATPGALIHTAWGLLLQQYNNTNDVVFGSVVSGRSAPLTGIEEAVGLFINTIPFRVNGSDDQTFEQVLNKIQEKMLASRSYEHVPLNEIQSHTRLKQELMDHILVIENYSPVMDTQDQTPGDNNSQNNLGFSSTGLSISGQSNYDLDVIVGTGEELLIRFRYNSLVYRADTMERLGAHFLRILQQVSENPQISLNQIDILSAAEKNRLLVEFNHTEAAYPDDKTIHELFEEQVEKYGDNIAVAFPGNAPAAPGGQRSLTYRELNRQADQLADSLIQMGVVPGSIVPMMLEPSVEMIVGMLGILKAGGAYLPIDPQYPEERIDFMLRDSSAGICLDKETYRACMSRVPQTGSRHLSLRPKHSPKSVAYVIYTSGSTGKPKGVLIDHRNVVRLMINDKSQFDFSHQDIWTLFHSYCFDFSVWEMYGALLYGGKLIIVPRDTARDTGRFINVLQEENVTVLNQTPSAFYNLIMMSEEMGTTAEQLKLRYIVFGGEALNPLKLKSWKQRFPQVKLINMFGITETTVHVTYKEIKESDTHHSLSNIGAPIPTLTTYVMDRNLKLLPIGASGELCVGGEGVAVGYLNRPELTAERFVENPYKPGELLYRSGDLGRLSPDGDMEYLGRIDLQVKVRGYRVETGEIEKQLLEHEEIKEAVVLLKSEENGDSHLCAYIVGTLTLTADSIPALKKYLSRTLPDYMIPSYFVQVPQIPLTSNGKIDRKTLVQYQVTTVNSQTNFVAPANETEEKMVEIWKNVLGIDEVSITDNFFNAGGDSIKAIRLVSAVNNRFKSNLKVIDVFTGNTIREMAQLVIHKAPVHEDEDLVRARKQIEELRAKVLSSGKLPGDIENIEGIYPMSDIEKGMTFHAYNNLDEAVYHDQFVYRQKYTSYDPAVLEKALRLMVQKHPILRTSFNVDDYEEFVHFVHKECPIPFSYHDIQDLDKEQQEKAVSDYLEKDRQNSWDIKTPPLWRLATFYIGDDDIYAVWTFHHAILDGWSNASFMTELNNTYLNLKADENYVPGKLKASYEDFILDEVVGKTKKENIDFWKNELADYKRTTFPAVTDQDTTVNDTHYITHTYESDYLEKLEKTAKDLNVSLKHMLFSAYVAMMNMLSRENDVTVGLLSNNRPECEDGDKLLGCFLNTLPFRLKTPGRLTWKDYISLVDEKLITLKKYEKMTFFEIVTLIGQRNSSENPIFDSIFAYTDFHIYQKAIKENTESDEPDGMLLQTYERTNTFFDFQANHFGAGLFIALTYSTSIVGDTVMNKLFNYYKNILDLIIAGPGQLQRNDEIMSGEERQQLLIDFNDTCSPVPGGKTIHQLFREQVERTPDNIAAAGYVGADTSEHVQLTYRQLDERSDQVADLLIEKGARPDTVVGIMMERSLEMIIGMFGILKAGAAYLPIEPGLPVNRIGSMLDDCNATLLLTQTEPVMKNPSAFKVLKNLCHIKHNPYKTGVRPQITDVESLPIPDRSLVDYDRYMPGVGQAWVKHTVTLLATRGCPYKCAYCHKIWPKTHFVRSAEHIFRELELYYNMGVRRFVITDDVFNLNKKNSMRFFQMVIDKGWNKSIQFYFPNGMRGDILTKEFIDLMVEAGTVSVALALETASPRLQKLIGKNLKLEKFKENVEYLCKTYPHVVTELFTMLGFPTETEEEALMTLEFIKSIRWLHFPYINILRIYSNTDMYKLAVANGVSPQDIFNSENLYYHEIPSTLPFSKEFVLRVQSEFLNDYFLSEERLLDVLPYQLAVMSEDEVARRYNGYLPFQINTLSDLLQHSGMPQHLDRFDTETFLDEDTFAVPQLHDKMLAHFPRKNPSKDAIKVLLLDMSQYFSDDSNRLDAVFEPPLGLMALMTYVNRQFGDNVNGKIAKSCVDFDSFDQLKEMIEEFQPDIIGIRTLTYYREFFHRTASLIRHWNKDIPIVAGGPYATSNYDTMLQDGNVDLVVLGEGEATFSELLEKMIANHNQLPAEDVLHDILGLAFIPGKKEPGQLSRDIIFLNQLTLPEEKSNSLKSRTAIEHAPQANPDNLAYVMFTSGTTGKPKGVMVEHRNVVSLLDWFGKNYNLEPGTRILQLTDYAFDPSVEDIFGSLTHGAALYVGSGDITIDKERFRRYVNEHKINMVNFVPLMLEELIGNDEKLQTLNTVISGGEKLDETVKDKLLERGYRLYNNYGPTEITVDALSAECSGEAVTLGKPIANVECHIVDRNVEPVPVGVAGELYIGGSGVVRGYLNSSRLTEEKFVSHPYHQNKRLYKTGDLARWLPNGNIDFLGRIDHQVKIRGFRIELGEIEAQLLTHKAVKEAAVVVLRDRGDNKHLCAYLVSDIQFTKTELNDYLAHNLPEYMLPSYFVFLDQMPLTHTGKVDRKNLPYPDSMETDANANYIAPETPVEKILADIWSDVLGRKKIGLNDNFFEIGGDSIKVIQIVSRMRKAGYKLETRDVLKNPEIHLLAPLVKKRERTVDQSTVTGSLPLTPVQKWFFENRSVDRHHFNQAVMLYSRDGFKEEAVKTVFSHLQHHHDALRITFSEENFDIIQVNHDDSQYPVSLNVYNYKGREDAVEALEASAAELQASIDLSNGPLMKLGLFHLDDGSRLLIIVHHLIVDGISWRILLEDIQALFEQYNNNETLSLPLKSDSLKTWAQQLSWYADSPSFLEEKEYWRQLEALPVPAIEKDFPQGENLIGDTSTLSFNLGSEETGRLLTRTNQAFGTEINDILLTALGLSIQKTFGHERMLIALEGHGREEILNDIDISRTIGWFTTIYPVVVDTGSHDDLARQVKTVKEELRRVPQKGIGHGILKYMTSPENKEDIQFQLDPRISFNYLGQFDGKVGKSDFGFAKESHGQLDSPNAQRDFDLDISGVISGKQLNISIIYGKNQYKPQTIQALIDNYKLQLQRVIDFCSNRQTRELTVSDLTYKKISTGTLEKIQNRYNHSVQDIYPLTPMQEGMLFHSVLEYGKPVYYSSVSYRLHGDLDVDTVRESLDRLFERYDILRTAFVHEDIDRPLQVLLADRRIGFYYKDIRGLDPAEQTRFVSRHKNTDRVRSFQLDTDVLMRIAVIQLGDSEYEFTWSHHHILIDGWCMSILFAEYFQIYNSLLANEEYRLPPVKPYRQYIEWLEKQDKKESQNYWAHYFESYNQLAGLPQKEPDSENSTYKKETVNFYIQQQDAQKLNQLAVKEHATLNTVVQAVWGILLGKYADRQDVVFGAVVSGRPSEIDGVETMVGLFINTIPVRIQYEESMAFHQLIRQIQKDAVESTPHHYYPLAEIQAATLLKQDLFNHIIAFENYPIEEQIDGMSGKGNGKVNGKGKGKGNDSGKSLETSDVEVFAQSSYDLEVTVISGKRLNVNLNFNANVYDPKTIEKAGRQFNDLLLQVAQNPGIQVNELSMLSQEEKDQLLRQIKEQQGTLMHDNIEINQPQDHVLNADFDY